MLTLSMTDAHSFTTEALVEWALHRANVTGRTQLVVRTTGLSAAADPFDWWVRDRAAFTEASYFAGPPEDVVLCALGTARELRSSDQRPVTALTDAFRNTMWDVIADGPPTSVSGPVAIGGFAFDGANERAPEWSAFPVGRLVIPQIVVRRHHGVSTLTAAVEAAPGADARHIVERLRSALDERPPTPSPAADSPKNSYDSGATAEWLAAVQRAAADVRSGRFAKLVLARRRRVSLRRVLCVESALRRMRGADPNAFVFAFARGDRTFVGASPERLVTLSAGRFAVDALAGTSRRGTTPDEDARLATALLSDPKERAEHATVVDAIRSLLADVSAELIVPVEPVLRTMRNVHHLWTPMSGQIDVHNGVLGLVDRLHPTPAVAGWPRVEAITAIREREGFDRGWYAGPVGWVDANGEGTFAVAIRSALIGPDEALLYAGCGIMGNSDAAAEFAETELKFRTMAAALGLA
jgi:isochorismate synthase